MYIEYVNYQNVGAVHNISIPFPFHEIDTPKPVVFVGENGSGKSILLSNIVDAFYEIANKAFTNVSEKDRMVTKFYKVITPIQISRGQSYMSANVRFNEGGSKVEYIFKGGNKNWTDYNTEQFTNQPLKDSLKWEKDIESHKAVTYQTLPINDSKKDKIEQIFSSNVICYFPPDRYEKPNWLSDSYHTISEQEHIGISEKYSGNLYTPITVFNPVNDNLKWLLDVIVDSRAEVGQNVTFQNGKLQISYAFAPRFNQGNLSPLMNARLNVEQILSDILGKQICFELNMRNIKTSGRFQIVERNNGNVVIPTFDSLSTGQMALFNLFVTLIRYADYNDVNKSINLNDISGIVVIDEIELHLHSKLQRDILPKLIKRFPKIQFVITSHSPLFILGMEKLFGADGYELYQMPDARKISAEMFSEFQKAYDYLAETQKYQSEVADAIQSTVGKTLIVTEGATDWKHIKRAYEILKGKEEYQALLENLDIEFLEYEPKNSKSQISVKLEMGGLALCTMCENFAKMPQSRKIIFIADNDDKTTNAKLGDLATGYKNWGNNVYSFTLPVPSFRKETPDICIEHLYTDEIINTSVTCDNGVSRRLFLGNEFNELGLGIGDNPYFCTNRNACGSTKIQIIDGSEKERVVEKNSESTTLTNYALSKMRFAEQLISGSVGFERVSFDNFIPIFETIRKILFPEIP